MLQIWKETEKLINERFITKIEIKYHNVIMGLNPKNYKNHEAINTIIMAVKKIQTLSNTNGDLGTLEVLFNINIESVTYKP